MPDKEKANPNILKLIYLMGLMLLLVISAFAILSVSAEESPSLTRIQTYPYGFQNQGYELQTKYDFYPNGSLLVSNNEGVEFFFEAPRFQPNVPYSVSYSENESYVIQSFFVNGTDNNGIVQTLNLKAYFDFSLNQHSAKISLIGNTTDLDSEIEYEFENPRSASIQNTATSYKIGNIVFDWSDLQGATTFLFALNKLKVKFASQFNLDPSIVSAVQDWSATDFSFQRKLGDANGWWWAFYYSSSDFVYRSSIDGTTWGAETIAIPNGVSGSIVIKDNYVHVASTTTSALFYRKGLLDTDGIISWSTSAQNTGSGNVETPSITVDSDGYPYIVASDAYYLHVTKSSFNNGSWNTAPSYPIHLSQVASGSGFGFWYGSIVALSNNKLYVVYSNGSITFHNFFFGREYNGSSWLSEETITSTSDSYWSMSHSTVAINNDVHFVYTKSWTPSIVYLKRTYGVGWNVETTLETALSPFSPTISTEGSNLWVFYRLDTSQTINYRRFYNGAWESSVIIINEKSASVTSIIEETSNNEVAILYTTNSEPYYVKFHKLTTTVTPPWIDIGTTGEQPPTEEEQPTEEIVVEEPSILPKLGLLGLIGGVATVAVVVIFQAVGSVEHSSRPTPRKKQVPQYQNRNYERKRERPHH